VDRFTTEYALRRPQAGMGVYDVQLGAKRGMPVKLLPNTGKMILEQVASLFASFLGMFTVLEMRVSVHTHEAYLWMPFIDALLQRWRDMRLDITYLRHDGPELF
jgi:hypothetical protein